MRLFPGVNFRIGGYLVPEVFWPGFFFPAMMFALLYAWPFLEKLITLDFKSHNVLRWPYQQPFCTALGCAVVALLVVLEFGGADDVVALAGGTEVGALRNLLRVLVFVVPAVTGVVSYLICAWWRQRRASEEAGLKIGNEAIEELIQPQ
jgi:ubiquinol-cytochrome c reductase cytochrome b subunit